MNWRSGTVVALLLVTVGLCLFEFVLQRQSDSFREFETALLSLQWIMLVCLAVWCGTLLFLTFSLNDLPLIILLLIAMAAYFIDYAIRPAMDALILLAAATLGKAARMFLCSNRRASAPTDKSETDQSGLIPYYGTATFLIGLVGLLAFASWWHLDMSNYFYHGPRWMGPWDNPNDYGLLMGVGVTLEAGLLAGRQKARIKRRKAETLQQPAASSQNWFLRSLCSFAAIKSAILLIAAGMMGVGLLFSYSRGAWVGTAIGLLYLAWSYGKFKWRYVLPVIVIVAAVVWFFWNATQDTAPWFVKRLDFSRPSAQHRVAAWKAGLEIMQDHPFGVGWNKAVETYAQHYSPPEDGATAITTNDYLMLGTQLGWPGLICFLAYVALYFRPHPTPAKRREGEKRKAETSVNAEGRMKNAENASMILDSLRAACRAGALAMLVAFWFDGGLFKLATASVFWILLELGSAKSAPPKAATAPVPA